MLGMFCVAIITLLLVIAKKKTIFLLNVNKLAITGTANVLFYMVFLIF